MKVKKNIPNVIYFGLIAVILIILILVAFEPSREKNIRELIQPVKVIAGEADTVIISDLFYADNYELEFFENEKIEVKYYPTENKLVFVPDLEFEGLELVDFKFGKDRYSIPVISKKIDKQVFKFQPEKKYRNITLFGNFNSWDRQNLPMTDENGDGIYEISHPLEPGQYQYKFFADGEEILDPQNPISIPNGIGGYNSVITVAEKFTGKVFLHIGNYSTIRDKSLFTFTYENSNPPHTLRDNEITALIDNKKIYSENITVSGNKIEVSLETRFLKGEQTLRVAVDQKGQVSNFQIIRLIDGKPADNNNVSWYDGTIYSLMVDRFNDGDKSLNIKVVHDSVTQKANYYGGDLEGIIQKLKAGYFNSLGANIIWLSPVYDNPNNAYREFPVPHRWYSGYHGYWPIHHERVEEKFGSIEKLKELIAIAHDYKIKILLDFVSNHVHEQHPFFKEHRDWFGKLELPDGRLNLRYWDEFRLTTWFEPYLPSFDYLASDEAVEAMTDNAVWWLRETGADGFRHDAVKHVPNKFWRRLTQKIKQEIEVPENKTVYQIGETFGGYDLVSSYVNHGQLSSQFNFELYNVAQSVFIDPDRSFNSLDFEMKKTFDVFGTRHLMGNIMDSHDKNRYMAYADGDLDLSQWSAIELGWNNPPVVDHPSSYQKATLYFAYMFTIPGLPVIYYGSEFGMTGASDPDNRRMMRFDEQLNQYEKNMLKNIEMISKIRNEHPALRTGDFYTLEADKNIYAFIRSDLNERMLVVINKSADSQNVNLHLPEFYNISTGTDLITGNTFSEEAGKLNLNIAPQNFYILNLK